MELSFPSELMSFDSSFKLDRRIVLSSPHQLKCTECLLSKHLAVDNLKKRGWKGQMGQKENKNICF